MVTLMATLPPQSSAASAPSSSTPWSQTPHLHSGLYRFLSLKPQPQPSIWRDRLRHPLLPHDLPSRSQAPYLHYHKYDEPIDLDEKEASTAEDFDNMKSENTPQVTDLSFPTDQCMFCAGDASLRAFRPRSNSGPIRYGITWRTSTSVG